LTLVLPYIFYLKEVDMPVIIFEGGKMPPEKKEELLRELTETSAKVTGIDAASFIVYIHENELDSIGVGGEVLAKILSRRK
jgi:4-oxalocrotonate tautomerase